MLSPVQEGCEARSFNITTTNAACGSLAVDSTISVQVNVTNAAVGTVAGFEFYLYYDPTYLSATSADTLPPSVFPMPQLTTKQFFPAGTVHLVGACLACSNTSSNGVLVNINFKILAVGVSPLTLAAGLSPMVTRRVSPCWESPTAQGAVFLVPTTADGYFKNEPTKLVRSPASRSCQPL